ncbi:MAG: LLM class flavin-dependent oxidoreductase [Gammaproteobacteria bacterium]|nr:LLM class flavin-dependent oxidoreductase [Gammaproteobacteria bacterium]
MRIDVLLEPDQTPDQLVELARLCERHGISRMWLQNYVSWRDPFMSLVPAALATSKVGLGVCVISPWEMHPVKMANALLTLQEYSRGRAALVIGGGGEWPARLGLEINKRVRCVREAIELVRGGVAGGKGTTYQGEMYKVYGYRPSFGSEQPPLVYAGANQPQMLRATVPAADGVMYSDMTRQLIGTTVQRTLDALATRDRPRAGYRINNIWAWHVKADRELAMREARRELLLRGLMERWYLESFLPSEEIDLIEKNKGGLFKAYRDRSGVIDGIPASIIDACIANFTFTGTPEEIAPRIGELAAFRDAGVDEINFRLHDDPAEAIRLIGEHVVAKLA